MWQPIEVTGGVVRSRDARALALGELVTASNCGLRPGDNVQVHNDVGSTPFGTPLNTVVAGPFYLSFESSADKLLVVTTDGSSSYLETATASTTGTWASIQTITGVVTAAGVVHRGDQYFVGTDQGNYVVQDNVSRAMGMAAVKASQNFAGTTAGSGTNPIVYGDAFVYWITEYDSTNDIESDVVYQNIGIVTTTGHDIGVEWPSTKQNSNADKVRIYRMYCGSADPDSDSAIEYESDAVSLVNSVANNKSPFTGGLLAEVDYAATTATWGANSYLDTFSGGKWDPSVQFPLVSTDAVYGGAIFRFLIKPRDFTLGVVFNDCLVVNDPDTSKQIIRYSPPGYPEYQPDPYFMYFATDRSDEVVGLHTVNGRLIVLTTSAAHRVNYLPLAGDIVGQQGRVQEVITGIAGCVGRHASAKVQTENGELVVWLSKRGLEWSNGTGWSDACPDFTGSLIVGSSPVLVNNEALYRLELYDTGQRWDFYYHPGHMKNGRLKLMGPSTPPGTISKGGVSNRDYVWVSSSSSVYTVNVGTNSEDSVLLTGHVRGSDPFADLTCDGLAITHSGNAATTYTTRIYGKLDGVVEADSGPETIVNPELDETSRAAVNMRGRYLRAQLTISGGEAWSAGPLWLEASQEEGPNG